MTVVMNYVPADLINERRWDYATHIQEALDANFVGGDAGEVLDQAVEGRVGLLKIYNYEEGSPPRDMAVLALDTVDTNHGQMLRVISLHGTSMDMWLDELVMMLKNIANDNDCAGVTFTGRNGWEKKLKCYGFNTVQRIMHMRV